MLAGALFLLRNTFTQEDTANSPVAATSGTSGNPGGAGTQPVLAQEDAGNEGAVVPDNGHAGTNNTAGGNTGNPGAVAANTGTANTAARVNNAGNNIASNNSGAIGRANNAIAGNNNVPNNSAARANNVIAGNNNVPDNSATSANNAIAGNNNILNNSAAHADNAIAKNNTIPDNSATSANNAVAGNNTIPGNTSSITGNNTFAAANAADLSRLRTRSAPVRNLRQTVNTDLSGDIPGVKDQEMPAMNNKPSIDIKAAANLATAAPAPPPGELIMSVTGNGLESKVLDKMTNVAKLFSRKRNNK
jgi:hypothetical protein